MFATARTFFYFGYIVFHFALIFFEFGVCLVVSVSGKMPKRICCTGSSLVLARYWFQLLWWNFFGWRGRPNIWKGFQYAIDNDASDASEELSDHEDDVKQPDQTVISSVTGKSSAKAEQWQTVIHKINYPML